MSNDSPFTDRRLCELFGIDYPIVQGGMIWVSGAKLAAAVSAAGGLGLIGSGSMKPELLAEHIRKALDLTDRPVGVNIPMHRGDADDLVETTLKEGIRIVFTSAGNPMKYTRDLKAAGCKVAPVLYFRPLPCA